jgi:hypothetical protein
VANISFVQRDFSSMRDAQALGRELPPADVTVLTHGIVAAAKREETAEGLECDMAVSCLSRLVILRELLPRLPARARVFVVGMPGNGADNFRLDDLNAEKGYEGGFGFVHINTVGGNEALVLHLAAEQRAKAAAAKNKAGGGGGVALFGVNPGLLPTGIRDVMHGGRATCSGACMEGLLGCFTPSLAKYASTMVPLFFAPGLEAHSGAMFGQKGTAIKINPEFEPHGRASEWYNAMEALLKAKVPDL